VRLRESPVVLPALGAVALFVAWATDEGGYPVTHWAPGGLIVLALLGIATWAIGWRKGVPRAVLVALACLAGYTAWSFLSILWAGVPGDALEGADRTLLYLLVFALFAGFRMRSDGAALLLLTWTLALIGVATFVVVHVNWLADAALLSALPGGRLVYPVGYVNAAAAQWMMAAWPALLMARSERLHPGLRGLLAGGAVLLTDVALLSLSRGAVLASAVVLVPVFVFLPRRLRTFAVIVPVALAVGASTPTLLKVGDRLEHGATNSAALRAGESALHSATAVIFAAAVLAGLVVGIAAAFEASKSFSPRARFQTRRVLRVLSAAALVLLVGGGLAAAGNPVTRARHAWDSFKSPRGYEANATGNRLVSGLGSNRYDFYRVALDEFAAHPLLGLGAENFSQQYLRRSRSPETPRYPHSVELRTLSETGIIGTLLAVVGLAAALLASARAIRGTDPLACAVAAAALTGFGYWLIHGSADWFWEYAGLGAPAFAMLGIACALDPGPASHRAATSALASPLPAGAEPLPPSDAATGSRWHRLTGVRRPGARRGRVIGALAGIVLALVAAVLLAAPWLSELEVQSAAHVWARAPSTAYTRLNSAARVDPLSANPYLLAGSIALRLGEPARADHEFALALGRSPENQYATLERGAIASERGESARALALLTRALSLYPRDQLTRQALDLTRAGGRVNVAELNRALLGEAQTLE
jgi:tetratricopeptide (TPR) repeat protein